MSIMRTTLEIIRKKIDDTFQAADPIQDAWVILSNIVSQDGTSNPAAQNKVVMCVAHIQPETYITSTARPSTATSGSLAVIPPPLYINLWLLFYANFEGHSYGESLEMISRTIAFFQRNPVFTRENAPDLDPAIGKLTIELENLDAPSLNNMLTSMGAKYLPAVCYKLRMIPYNGT